MRIGFVGLAAAAVAIGMPLTASATDDARLNFLRCDGYLEPKGSDDHIIGAPFRTTIGERGNNACDLALVDPRLTDDMWLRRAHLFQYKAVHLIGMGRFADALAQLDLSDKLQVERGDVWSDRSIGVANRMLRAVALYRLDRKDEARRMLGAAVAARAYAPSIARLARSIEMSFDYDRGTQERLARQGARLSPSLISILFWAAIVDDDFAAAERLAGQISFDLPKGHGSWSIERTTSQYAVIQDRARTAGALAYAKLALGKRDEARATMAAARADVADALEPPQPGANGKQPNQRLVVEWATRKPYGQAAAGELDYWDHAMTVRDEVAGRSLAAAGIILQEEHGDRIATVTDILRQIAPASDAERAAIGSMIDGYGRSKDIARRKAMAFDMTQLVALLPEPEPIAYRPKFRKEGGYFFNGKRDNGFVVTPDPATGLVFVRFGATVCSRAEVEEGALLAAAQYARAQGRDAFIVTSAQTILRQKELGGRDAGTYDVGYETQIQVRVVDSAALPVDLEPMRWRLIRSDDVITDLGPKYLVGTSDK